MNIVRLIQVIAIHLAGSEKFNFSIWTKIFSFVKFQFELDIGGRYDGFLLDDRKMRIITNSNYSVVSNVIQKVRFWFLNSLTQLTESHVFNVCRIDIIFSQGFVWKNLHSLISKSQSFSVINSVLIPTVKFNTITNSIRTITNGLHLEKFILNKSVSLQTW